MMIAKKFFDISVLVAEIQHFEFLTTR